MNRPPPASGRLLRTLHRWLALVFVLPMAIIGVTGAILQAILAVYGEPAGPGGTWPASAMVPNWVVSLHDVVLKIHTGFFAGVAGAWYGLACGVGLLFFSISGVWMLAKMYLARFPRGGRSPFWGGGSSMRALHRWLAAGLGAFALLVSFTGASLDFDFVRHDQVPGNGLPPSLHGTATLPPPPSGAHWHVLSFSLHKLDFLGVLGHGLGVVLGAGLATFAVSGLWMYLSMRRRRARAGQRGLFW